MKNISKSDEQLLAEFTTASLQICKIEVRMKELQKIKADLEIKRDRAFGLYEDRQKQKGREIDLPEYLETDNLDLEK